MTVTTLCACALTVCLLVFLRSAHEFAAQLKSALIRVHREKTSEHNSNNLAVCRVCLRPQLISIGGR